MDYSVRWFKRSWWVQLIICGKLHPSKFLEKPVFSSMSKHKLECVILKFNLGFLDI